MLEQFKNDALPNSRDLRYFLFQSLPIGQERNKVKFLFYKYLELLLEILKWKMLYYMLVSNFTQYVFAFLQIMYQYLQVVFRPENLRERPELLGLFDIQIEIKNCYRFVELYRTNLEEWIGEFFDMGMIFNRTEDELLFHAKTCKETPNHLVILIYKKNSDCFEETIKVFSSVLKSFFS